MAWSPLTGCLLALAIVAPAQDDPALSKPPTEPVRRTDSPVYVILNAPGDLSALVERIREPDFVVVEWQRFRRLLDNLEAPAPGSRNTATVQSNRISIVVEDDNARVLHELQVQLGDDGPHDLHLPIDNPTITDARDGEHSLILSHTTTAGWVATLSGKGTHALSISMDVPIRSTGLRRSMELSIPEAATNQLKLQTAEPVADVRVGDALVPPSEPPTTHQGGAFTAQFSPRSRLGVSWRSAANPRAGSAPASVAALGEVSLDYEPGQVQVTAAYDVRAIGRPVDFLTLKIDPGWDGLRIEFDGAAQPVVTASTDGGDRFLKIAVNLSPETQRRMVIRARRLVDTQRESEWTFQGFPISEAQAQTGLIAVSRAGDVGLSGSAARAIRQVDHRSELPANLRVHPTVVLGYQYFDQPFELRLRSVPQSPWQRVEGRIALDVGSERVDLFARFEARLGNRGQIDLSFVVPDRWTIDEVGPAELVESFELTGAGATRQATIRLNPGAAEKSAFAIQINAHAPLGSGEQEFSLISPVSAASFGGWLAIGPDPGLDLRLADMAEYRAAARDVTGIAMWPEEARNLIASADTVWFRFDSRARAITLAASKRPLELRSAAVARIDVLDDETALAQTIDIDARYGNIEAVDFIVPAELVESWQLDGPEVASRETLATDADNSARVRVRFVDAISSSARLVVRGRLPRTNSGSESFVVAPKAVRIANARAEQIRLEVRNAPEIELSDPERRWNVEAIDDSDQIAAPTASATQLAWTGASASDSPPPLSARRLTPVSGPRLLIRRSLLRTNTMADGTTRIEALLAVERHAGVLRLGLPIRASWIGASVNGKPVSAASEASATNVFRLPLEENSRADQVVTVEYSVDANVNAGDWAPKLDRDAAVQSAYWEVEVPPSALLIGTPNGWHDENAWAWDGLLMQRKPSVSDNMIWRWVAGDRATAPEQRTSPRGVRQRAYLFSRNSGFQTAPLPLMTRVWLVSAMSSLALLATVSLVVVSPTWRSRMLLAAGLLGVAAFARWPLTSAQIASAAIPGLSLGLLAIGIQRAVSRRSDRSAPARASRDREPKPAAGGNSALDGSTFIRPRQLSTVDQIPVTTEPASTPSAERQRS